MSYKNIKSKFRMAGNVYLNGDTFESMRSLHQDLTFDDAGKSFARYDVDFGEDKFIALGLRNIHDDQYTNLALLLSDQCQHTIKVAVFADEARTVFKDAKEFGGSLFRQLEDAYSYLLLCNRTASSFQGLERMEKKDYPEEALREALLNAMVHRDYSFSGSTLISIFDDRIEFVTIGGLVRGLTFNDIMLGVSALRNKKLANVFYRLRLIEAYGTGILRINECYADSEVKPLFEVTDNAFKITLPNRNFTGERKETTPAVPARTKDKAQRQDIILRLAKKQGTVTRKDVETALQVSQSSAILILREMVDNGLLVKDGAGKQLKYAVPEQR